MDLSGLQKKINYFFKDPLLLEQALTHSSFAHETGRDDNEKLEFLGDSLLGMLVSEYLFRNMPGSDEGGLSILKSAAVSMRTLGRISGKMGLGGCCFLGRGEELSGGRERPSILAGMLEALIAAVYLDGGLESCREFVLKFMSVEFERIESNTRGREYKGMLQEHAQSEYGLKPVYSVLEARGAEHEKVFRVEVRIGSSVLGEGEGGSKKEAEKAAAKNGLEFILDRPRSGRVFGGSRQI